MKSKHLFALGALTAGGLAAMAIETIPLTFKEGQVISAGTMNAVFARVNMITRQPVGSDLVGTWNCIETVPAIGNYYTYKADESGLIATRENTLEFSAPSSGGVYPLKTTMSVFQNSGNHTMAAMRPGTRLLVLKGPQNALPLSVSYLDRDRLEAVSYATLTTGIDHADAPAFLNCVKTNAAPAPADSLTTTLNGSNADLEWVDQSGTETGFRIEQKTSADGAWATVKTAPANATTASIPLSNGTYWFRVVAFNAVGDAMPSAEVQLVAP